MVVFSKNALVTDCLKGAFVADIKHLYCTCLVNTVNILQSGKNPVNTRKNGLSQSVRIPYAPHFLPSETLDFTGFLGVYYLSKYSSEHGGEHYFCTLSHC
jgi:hypothetical protein